MAARIITNFNSHYNKHNIAYAIYPERQDVESESPGPKGRILPPTKGFSADYKPPSVSFKTYRSMAAFGQKQVADYILQNRKRSFVTPNYVWNGIMKFSQKTVPRLDCIEYASALDRLRNTLQLDKKIPIMSMDDAVAGIPRSTSPGFPWITTHPGFKKGDIIDCFLPIIKQYWKAVGNGEPTLPLPDCAAFARSHISTVDKNKVRPVWAYPLHVVCQEAKYTYPLTKLLKDQKIFPESAYGMEMMKGGMTWLNNQAVRASLQYPGCKFLMTDYSSFDATVPAWLIRDVFTIIADKFDFSKMSVGGYVVSVDPEKERNKFRKFVNYFINTPIRNSDGRRFLKDHGVPSGSMWTNIIDTCINFVVSHTLSDQVFDTQPIFSVFFGDDGCMCFPDSAVMDVDAFAQTALNCFGMVISKNKTIATRNRKNIHFLGYFNYDGTPVKSSIDLIASMLYPQYEKDDWAYCISRALGCLLASAGTSTDVFLSARAVYLHAARLGPQDLDRGLEMVKTHPRMRRFVDQLGCGELNITHDYFHDIKMSIPFANCNKLECRVNLV